MIRSRSLDWHTHPIHADDSDFSDEAYENCANGLRRHVISVQLLAAEDRARNTFSCGNCKGMKARWESTEQHLGDLHQEFNDCAIDQLRRTVERLEGLLQEKGV